MIGLTNRALIGLHNIAWLVIQDPNNEFLAKLSILFVGLLYVKFWVAGRLTI